MTINLHDVIVEMAKQRARAQGRTFTSLVEEGLRAVLAERVTADETVELAAYGTPGGRVLVDLTDEDATWAALDPDGIR